MEYCVVSTAPKDYAESLAEKVNSKIAKGWMPLGGICAESWEAGCVFHQAMIREPQTGQQERGEG